MSYSKYGNYKVTYDGRKFDSKKECERYIQLRALQRQGYISELECQKKYVLLPAQRGPDRINAKGKPLKGKLLFREFAYYADFVYKDQLGCVVVEDVKGFKTPIYNLKKAMMYYFHKILIKEV